MTGTKNLPNKGVVITNACVLFVNLLFLLLCWEFDFVNSTLHEFDYNKSFDNILFIHAYSFNSLQNIC